MRRLGAVLVGVVLAAGSLVAVGVAPTGALTTITVTSNADSLGVCPGPTCTLRQALLDAAIASASDDVAIVIQAGVGTIAPAMDLPFFPALGSHALTIRGNGATIQYISGLGLINFSSLGLLTVDGLTFSGGNNSALGGGALQVAGSVTVTNSTFTGNTALIGGAIAAGKAVSVTNSTFTGNSAGLGGGAIYSDVGVSVAYSTFTGNTANAGSAIATGQSGTIRVFGSVFVKPAGPSALCVAGVPITSFGYNYANETANSCGLTATGDSSLDANDPLLGALANNGGPTQTQLPQTASQLLNAIPSTACQTAPLATGTTTDQRGLARPGPTGGACDIGAVEVQVTPVEKVINFTG